MFKIGDRIECISKGNNKNITLGNIYMVYRIDKITNTLSVSNDIAKLHRYNIKNFKLVEKKKPTSEIEWLDKIQQNFRLENNDESDLYES